MAKRFIYRSQTNSLCIQCGFIEYNSVGVACASSQNAFDQFKMTTSPVEKDHRLTQRPSDFTIDTRQTLSADSAASMTASICSRFFCNLLRMPKTALFFEPIKKNAYREMHAAGRSRAALTARFFVAGTRIRAF